MPSKPGNRPSENRQPVNRQMERFISAAERLRLDEYVRFATDRRARMRDAFFQGIFRGLGAMIGFSILGAVVIYILQLIAQRNLPGISDFVARVITLVKIRIE